MFTNERSERGEIFTFSLLNRTILWYLNILLVNHISRRYNNVLLSVILMKWPRSEKIYLRLEKFQKLLRASRASEPKISQFCVLKNIFFQFSISCFNHIILSEQLMTLWSLHNTRIDRALLMMIYTDQKLATTYQIPQWAWACGAESFSLFASEIYDIR